MPWMVAKGGVGFFITGEADSCGVGSGLGGTESFGQAISRYGCRPMPAVLGGRGGEPCAWLKRSSWSNLLLPDQPSLQALQGALSAHATADNLDFWRGRENTTSSRHRRSRHAELGIARTRDLLGGDVAGGFPPGPGNAIGAQFHDIGLPRTGVPRRLPGVARVLGVRLGRCEPCHRRHSGDLTSFASTLKKTGQNP